MLELDRIRERYTAASDVEMLEAQAEGESSYRPEVWDLIQREIARRGIERPPASQTRIEAPDTAPRSRAGPTDPAARADAARTGRRYIRSCFAGWFVIFGLTTAYVFGTGGESVRVLIGSVLGWVGLLAGPAIAYGLFTVLLRGQTWARWAMVGYAIIDALVGPIRVLITGPHEPLLLGAAFAFAVSYLAIAAALAFTEEITVFLEEANSPATATEDQSPKR